MFVVLCFSSVSNYDLNSLVFHTGIYLLAEELG